MEFFGLTKYGFSSSIKDMIKDDYEEPKKPLPTNTEIKREQKSLSESIKELDCYVGIADGFAYGSCDRLTRMRKKHIWKPVGPTDMYAYPGVNSMNYGWWISDPVLTKLTVQENWFRPRVINSITSSEMSRFINHCLKVDRYFKV